MNLHASKYWKSYTARDGLLSNLVYSAAMDREGRLWFGCKGPNGAARFDGDNWRIFTSESCGLGPGHVWDVAVDEGGNVWFGTAGGGLSVFDGKSWKTFTMKDGLAGNHVYAVKAAPRGKIWCGCAPMPDTIVREGGVSVFDGNRFENFTSNFVQGQRVGGGNSELCDNRVYSIARDPRGRVWFGTKGGGISRFDGSDWKTYDTTSGLPVNEVGDGAAAVDADGSVWFGLRGGGACRIFDDSVRVYTMRDGLAGNFVYAIQLGPDGRMWFGCSPHPEKISQEGGIAVFDGGSFRRYTSDYVGGTYVGGGNSLLVDNRVYAIVFDRDGNGWFGTKGGGVSRLSREAIGS
jgi:ligand-binding sensor domain-containing protein